MSHTTLQLILCVPPTCGWVVIVQLKKVCSVNLQWSRRFCQNSHTNTWISPSCPRLGIGAMLMVRNFYLTSIDSFFHCVSNTVIKSSPFFTVLYSTSVSSRDPDNFRSYRVCTLCQAPQVLSWVLSESPALLTYSDHSFAHKLPGWCRSQCQRCLFLVSGYGLSLGLLQSLFVLESRNFSAESQPCFAI